MADDLPVLLKSPDQIAADDLHVIEIVLQPQVRPVDLGDHIGGVLHPVEKIARHVARIDGLDIELDVLFRRQIGGAFQVLDEHGIGLGARGLIDLAGQAVNGAGADGGDEVERVGEGFSPVILTAGHGAKTEFAVAARGRIDAERLHVIALERTPEFARPARLPESGTRPP